MPRAEQSERHTIDELDVQDENHIIIRHGDTFDTFQCQTPKTPADS